MPPVEALRRAMPEAYDFIRPLGAGGCGFVVLARQRSTGREVALKLLHGDRLGDARALQRFRREARIMGSLCNGHVLTVYDFGDAPGGPYLALEVMDGGSLSARLAREGPVDGARALDWTAQILDGLAALHGQGVIHRDVKPENVFLAADGTAKLGDLGLATGSAVTRMTRTGALVGTPRYLAPELLRGERASEASDLYAVGVTLWALLQGRVPFEEARNLTELLAAVLVGADELPDPPAGMARPAAWPALRAFVASLLSPEPALRPPSAEVARRHCERLRASLDEEMPSTLPWHGPSTEGDTERLPAQAVPVLADGDAADGAVMNGASSSPSHPRSAKQPAGGRDAPPPPIPGRAVPGGPGRRGALPPARLGATAAGTAGRKRVLVASGLLLLIVAGALAVPRLMDRIERDDRARRFDALMKEMAQRPFSPQRGEDGALRLSFVLPAACRCRLRATTAAGRSLETTASTGNHHAHVLSLGLLDELSRLDLDVALPDGEGPWRSLSLPPPPEPRAELEALFGAVAARSSHAWILAFHQESTRSGRGRPRPGTASWTEGRKRFRAVVDGLDTTVRARRCRPWLLRAIEDEALPLGFRWKALSTLQDLALADRVSWIGAGAAGLDLAGHRWSHARPWARGERVLRRLAARRRLGKAPEQIHLQLRYNAWKDSFYWNQETEIRGELRNFWEAVTTSSNQPSVYHREQRGQFTMPEDGPWRASLSLVLVTWQLAPNMVFVVEVKGGRGETLRLLFGRCTHDGEGRVLEKADSGGRYGADLRLDLPPGLFPPGRYEYVIRLHKVYDEGAWENSALSRLVLAGPFATAGPTQTR